MARTVGSHFLTAKKLLILIPIMNTTNGSSVRAVYLPFTTPAMTLYLHFPFEAQLSYPSRSTSILHTCAANSLQVWPMLSLRPVGQNYVAIRWWVFVHQVGQGLAGRS